MKRALVVDNNEFYRKVLGDFLAEEGYRVEKAEDGLAALRAAAAERPDLIMLDLVMPKLDGVKVCRQLKADERTRPIPVVVLSGVLVEDIGNLRGIGADAYVAKMPLDRLLPCLRTIIRRLEEGCEETLIEGFEGMFRREIVVELLEEKRFRDLLFDSLAEGAAELDSDRRIVSVNPAFAELCGRDELEVIDQSVETVLCLDDSALAGLFREGTEPGCTRINLGGRHLRLQVSRVARKETPLGYMLLAEDVTEIMRAETEREQFQRQLAHTEKLSALGQMVAGVAHELNNPLTGVLGYAQLILERSPDPSHQRDLRKILQEARRCQKVVDNLLAFSRRVAPVREPQEVNALIRECVSGVEADLAAGGIRLDLDLADGIPEVPLDRQQCRQVLHQLLRNARRAVTACPRPGVIRIASRVEADRLQITVQDNGVGISPENLDRVFDPFFTTGRVGEGSGLGLSVAYGILREHQGRISVHSRPDQGATFRIDFPLTVAEAKAVPEAGAAAPDRPGRVLVVDDEPVILDLLVDLLETQGMNVETALNGIEALEKIESADYDALILDLKMPEMGGREVYERLQEVRPSLRSRVVFSTGDMVSSEARQFFDRIAAPVLQKPFRIDKVTEILTQFLGPQAETSAQG